MVEDWDATPFLKSLKGKTMPENPEAFPNSTGVRCFSTGMTLRDYFAAAALQGIRARTEMYNSEVTAAMAMQDADAMLAERGKETS